MSEATIMQRRGTSLMEVLIAIFILALGLVSLLTLFPIGFVQMAKSLQDERAAQLAANATAYMRMTWKTACEASARNTPGGQALFTDAMSLNSFWSAMDDPNLYLNDTSFWNYLPPPNNPNQPVNPNQVVGVQPAINDLSVFLAPLTANSVTAATQRLASQAVQTRPSYPVFVDPVGWQAAGTGNPQQAWLGYRDNQKYAIPRRQISQMAMNYIPSVMTRDLINLGFTYKTSALRNCMLLDDMEFSAFDVNGNVSAKLNERVSQFSCAWLLRRDNNNKRSETNVTVVVFHRRSIESPSDEVAFHVDPSILPSSFPQDTPGRATLPVTVSIVGSDYTFPNSITLTYTAPNRPPLRRGSWILDATMDGPFSAPQTQGFYYRVTDFTETENPPGQFQNVLQLETRLRPRQAEITPPPGGTQPRLIVVQDRVLEVFDKGPLEMNSPSRIN
jgi:hypothetical protein